uniref:Uncharacterized protein n=1 Tax=Anguilla anguilla TaxID=7936 RepID=A0A0E9URT3_ANGAN
MAPLIMFGVQTSSVPTCRLTWVLPQGC